MTNNIIAEELKTLREKSGLRRGIFCDRIGISIDKLKNYESGRTEAPAEVIERARELTK